MSVLTYDQIEKLVAECGLIQNYSPHSLEGASYDMRMGSEFMREGQRFLLSEENPSVTLQPGEFLLLSTHEYLRMPLDIIGHNGIMSPWAKRGIVSLFSPQIDPGFEGILVVPVFNAGDADVTISLGDKIFTVEFVRADQPAPYGWADRYEPQTRIPQHVSPKAVRANLSDINRLQSDVQALRDTLSDIQAKMHEVEREFSYQTGLHKRAGFTLRKLGFYLAVAGAGAAVGGALGLDDALLGMLNGLVPPDG